MWSGLILNPHMVSYYQRWKPFCVLCPPFRCLHVPVSQSFFPQGESIFPGGMRDIAPRGYRYKILDGSPEYALSRRQLGAWVRGVSVLQYGSLECVSVEVTMWVCVVCDQPFDSFYPDLCPTVGMWEGNRGKSMVNSPIFQELLRGLCNELRSSICCALIRNAICRKGSP